MTVYKNDAVIAVLGPLLEAMGRNPNRLGGFRSEVLVCKAQSLVFIESTCRSQFTL